MRYKNKLFIILQIILYGLQAPCGVYAETASPDNVFVEGDQYAGDFASRLNRNTVQLSNSVNNVRGLFAGTLQTSGQIGAGTIGILNMADEANPATRLTENFSEYVESGMTISTSANLTTDITAGTAYPEGYRVVKSSSTSKTFTASRDTYVDIDKNGDFQYSEVALGAAAPAVAANSVRIARVSADGTKVAAVTDLRDLTLVDAAQNDAVNGMKLAFVSGDNFTVTSGYARSKGTSTTATANILLETTATKTVDLDVSGLNGLDTGSKAASTWYFLHVIGAKDGGQTVGFVLSTSEGEPTFPSNYDSNRMIAALRTNAQSNFHSFDQIGVSSTRRFMYRFAQRAADVNALNAPDTWQSLDLTNYIPTAKNKIAHLLINHEDNNQNGTFYVGIDGTDSDLGWYAYSLPASGSSYGNGVTMDVVTDTDSTIEYKHSASTNLSIEIDVVGYTIEV